MQASEEVRREDGCLFCEVLEGKRASYVFFETPTGCLSLDPEPLSELHLVYFFKRHVTNVSELTDRELKDLNIIYKIPEIFGDADGPYRFWIKSGDGCSRVSEHLHYHIIKNSKAFYNEDGSSKIILDRSSGFPRLDIPEGELQDMCETLKTKFEAYQSSA